MGLLQHALILGRVSKSGPLAHHQGMTSKNRYLVLLRSPATSGSNRNEGPSPEQLQKIFATYNAWKEKFREEILDIGDKLKPDGRTVTASGVADGPFVEAKEVVGGYMILTADDYARAVEVARACPAVNVPGVVLEVRELVGAKM
jgi:hypothetical protein